MNWMVSCTDIVSDPAGNIKPVKPDRGKSHKRIDGVVASIMALNAAVRNAGNDGGVGMEIWG
jgi:phage terminase large subunit-like protein